MQHQQHEIERLKDIIRQYYNCIVEAGKILNRLDCQNATNRLRGCVSRNKSAGKLDENKKIIT